MKGSNKITLNHETMVAALQQYFDTTVFAAGQAPKVNSISPDTDSRGYSSSTTFVVEVEQVTPPAKEAT